MTTTEKQIVESAINVFNADPSATLERVASVAGVTSRTLYRYFNERSKLIDACRELLTESCRAAFAAAFSADHEPLRQLELCLYAGIDCGSKFAFFNKLSKANPAPADGNEIQGKWLSIVQTLQKEGVITSDLTTAWINKLFTGMVNTTIEAINSGDIAPNDIKRFAWLSFSRSIGIAISQPVEGK